MINKKKTSSEWVIAANVCGQIKRVILQEDSPSEEWIIFSGSSMLGSKSKNLMH